MQSSRIVDINWCLLHDISCLQQVHILVHKDFLVLIQVELITREYEPLVLIVACFGHLKHGSTHSVRWIFHCHSEIILYQKIFCEIILVLVKPNVFATFIDSVYLSFSDDSISSLQFQMLIRNLSLDSLILHFFF